MVATIEVANIAHLVSTTPGPQGSSIKCSCGFNANAGLFGTREASRLGFAHIAYPDCTLPELMQGPPCAKEGR